MRELDGASVARAVRAVSTARGLSSDVSCSDMRCESGEVLIIVPVPSAPSAISPGPARLRRRCSVLVWAPGPGSLLHGGAQYAFGCCAQACARAPGAAHEPCQLSDAAAQRVPMAARAGADGERAVRRGPFWQVSFWRVPLLRAFCAVSHEPRRQRRCVRARRCVSARDVRVSRPYARPLRACARVAPRAWLLSGACARA